MNDNKETWKEIQRIRAKLIEIDLAFLTADPLKRQELKCRRLRLERDLNICAEWCDETDYEER